MSISQVRKNTERLSTNILPTYKIGINYLILYKFTWSTWIVLTGVKQFSILPSPSE